MLLWTSLLRWRMRTEAIARKRKRPPKKLTTVQIRVIGKLIEAHGRDNVDAMAKDMKLNKMQHSPGVLKKMVESYFAYPNLIDGEGRRDFHSVQKKG